MRETNIYIAEYQDTCPEETRPQVWSRRFITTPAQKRQDPKRSRRFITTPVQKRQDPKRSRRFIMTPVQKRQDPKWSRRYIRIPQSDITKRKVDWVEFFFTSKHIYIKPSSARMIGMRSGYIRPRRQRHLRGLYPSLYSTFTLPDGSGRA